MFLLRARTGTAGRAYERGINSQILPANIKEPLFQGDAPVESKRLNRFLSDCGIVDPRKVLNSFIALSGSSTQP